MERNHVLAQFEPRQENLLLILHSLQNNNPQNYLTQDDLSATADFLNLTKSSVYGVVKYYTMFSLKPRGRHLIRTCMSPVCRLLGGRDILIELEKLLGIKWGQTTKDGFITLEPSKCLGCCGNSPALLVDRTLHGNLTKAKLREIIAGIRNPSKLINKRGRQCQKKK
ncbi:MAG: NAD(P)H-dependent oxidoreductase subunit E [Planctomycetes bacterium]|nr:NAD(P)H-dependent oxidoreductase subunit E [Planctomycetota bacterium]